MGRNTIDDILGKNQPPEEAPETESKFFSILVGEGVAEHYLELRFKDGTRICVSYDELSWFAYDPENGKIDLDFGTGTVQLLGRGLGDRLFNGIRQKRVAWIKEADSEMEDHPKNETYISAIEIPQPEKDSSEKE